MFHQLFHAVYTQPLQNVLIMIAVAVPLWALISSLLPKKALKVVSLCILSFSLLFTLWITLFGRVPSDEYVPVFMPLSTFYRATENREMLRSALMNVFLFVPFGMTLPFILPDRLKHRLPITIAAAAALSLTIECCQLLFLLGTFETDDVLTNSLGAFLGALSLRLSLFFRKRRQKSLKG